MRINLSIYTMAKGWTNYEIKNWNKAIEILRDRLGLDTLADSVVRYGVVTGASELTISISEYRPNQYKIDELVYM